MKVSGFVLLAAMTTSGAAFAADAGAILGGALGGGVGAAVGSQVGGQGGAIMGGALGGAAGAAIGTSGQPQPAAAPVRRAPPPVQQVRGYDREYEDEHEHHRKHGDRDHRRERD